MNNTKLYAAILAVLLLGSVWVWYSNRTPKSTLIGNSSDFAFADTTAITKIILRDAKDFKIELTRQNTTDWQLNKRYAAKPFMVQQLLKTIAKVSVQSPVANAAKPNVLRMCQKPDKTVEIYTNNAQPAKKYYICGLTTNKNGTYALLDGSDKPYAIQILGLEGHLLTRYSTYEPDWCDPSIFRYNPADIATIELNYDNFFPSYSFKLTNLSPDSVTVEPLDKAEAPKNTKAFNKSFGLNYRNLFQQKNAEAYANEHSKLDSIKQSKPFCTITVTNRSGKIQVVPVHYMPINRRSKLQFDEKGKPIAFDRDRFFAFIHNQGDMVILQQFNFGDVFQRYEDFFGTSKATPKPETKQQ